jgi:hypothetical protein
MAITEKVSAVIIISESRILVIRRIAVKEQFDGNDRGLAAATINGWAVADSVTMPSTEEIGIKQICSFYRSEGSGRDWILHHG